VYLRVQHLGQLQGQPWRPANDREGFGVESDASFDVRLEHFWTRELWPQLAPWARSVLLVSHSGSIDQLLKAHFGPRGFIGAAELMARTPIPNCSVTLVRAHSADEGEVINIGNLTWLSSMRSEASGLKTDAA
jgi:broad specificity phosphatase PhoE